MKSRILHRIAKGNSRKRGVVNPGAGKLHALRRHNDRLDSAGVKDLLQPFRSESVFSEEEFLDGVAMPVGAAANVFDGHILVGRTQ